MSRRKEGRKEETAGIAHAAKLDTGPLTVEQLKRLDASFRYSPTALSPMLRRQFDHEERRKGGKKERVGGGAP